MIEKSFKHRFALKFIGIFASHYIFRYRRPDENVTERKSAVTPAFKIALIVPTFFVLMAFRLTEAQIPAEHNTCTACHIEEGSRTLRAGINETCIGCHPESPGRDHPIGIVAKDVSGKLPLDGEHKITCITCHEPHGKETTDRLLRMEFNTLCIFCHET